MVALFADTKTEDHDLYRFLPQAAADIGCDLVTIADGRDIWQVFKDVRMLGNSQFDPCSKLLKRVPLRKWLDNNTDPAAVTVILGYGPEEGDRIGKAMGYWSPYRVASPLANRFDLTSSYLYQWVQEVGLDPPRLYDEGFQHNNCGGGCVKAGIGQFVHLYHTLPDVYRQWENAEADWQHETGFDNTILKANYHGFGEPLSLAKLRRRIESGETFPTAQRFACGCFAAEPDAEELAVSLGLMKREGE